MWFSQTTCNHRFFKPFLFQLIQELVNSRAYPPTIPPFRWYGLFSHNLSHTFFPLAPHSFRYPLFFIQINSSPFLLSVVTYNESPRISMMNEWYGFLQYPRFTGGIHFQHLPPWFILSALHQSLQFWSTSLLPSWWLSPCSTPQVAVTRFSQINQIINICFDCFQQFDVKSVKTKNRDNITLEFESSYCGGIYLISPLRRT